MNTEDYRVIIIEDEKPSARFLQRKLETLGFHQIMMLHSVLQSKKWFAENPNPDLIFLDIQLSDGLSFEIFEDFEIDSAIIFTTAYDEYALKAFKLNSIDYLLKPIAEEELQFAIEKFKKQKEALQSFDYHQLRNILDPDRNFKTRFSIKVGQSIKLVNTEDIECLFSQNKGTYLYTKQKDQYLLDQSLDQLESNLDPNQFFRISRAHIVNIASIRSIAIHSNSRLRLELNNYPSQEIIVSRERVNDFKKWLG